MPGWFSRLKPLFLNTKTARVRSREGSGDNCEAMNGLEMDSSDETNDGNGNDGNNRITEYKRQNYVHTKETE